MRVVALAFAWLVACRSSSSTQLDAASDASDAAEGSHDAAPDAVLDATDGPPDRQPCTNNLGSALTEEFGRLDGTLVAIVQPGAHGCNGDDNHIHLQIHANNEVYDIAVDVGGEDGSDDVHTITTAKTLPAWSEGWHTGVLEDYVADGFHSTDLPLETAQQVADDINGDLATVNHISIFGTGYGPDGAHLVHRNGDGHDGLIVTEPLSTPSHARLFSFTDQAF